tara:strand:+ start:247 stop:612 length:366 start_codon:yes stop_codon:yes gene_type:complete
LYNTCNLTSTVQDQGFINRDSQEAAPDASDESKVADFYMFKCGHKFHKDCMIEKLKIDPDLLEEDGEDSSQDQDIQPKEVISLPTYKQRKKYVKKLFQKLEDTPQEEDLFEKCILCRQHDM